MTPLATIRTYDDLHRALRARADQLGINRQMLDQVAGWPNGYASKLLSPKPIKKFGELSMRLGLEALAVELVMVERPDALARISHAIHSRKVLPSMLAVNAGRGKHQLVSKRFLRKIASKGGQARARRLNPSWRRGIARKAAIIRWRDVKQKGGKNGKATSSKSK